MICSVKFFEPMVSAIPLLSGFSSIAVALASVVSSPESPSSSSSPPQAAIPSASTSAANNANNPL